MTRRLHLLTAAFLLFLVGRLAHAILHTFFGWEEHIITLLTLLPFLFVIIASFLDWLASGYPKDLWKLSYFTPIGFLGFVSSATYFVFFGFFLFLLCIPHQHVLTREEREPSHEPDDYLEHYA